MATYMWSNSAFELLLWITSVCVCCGVILWGVYVEPSDCDSGSCTDHLPWSGHGCQGEGIHWALCQPIPRRHPRWVTHTRQILSGGSLTSNVDASHTSSSCANSTVATYTTHDVILGPSVFALCSTSKHVKAHHTILGLTRLVQLRICHGFPGVCPV